MPTHKFKVNIWKEEDGWHLEPDMDAFEAATLEGDLKRLAGTDRVALKSKSEAMTLFKKFCHAVQGAFDYDKVEWVNRKPDNG